MAQRAKVRESSHHCIMNNMFVMKSAVLFVDIMEISWHRVQESHCTRQQNTTHLDHTERQLRGSYCYGFDNNGDDIHHICKNAEILEQKHTLLVKKGNGAYREEGANDFDGNHLFCNEAKREQNSLCTPRYS